MGTSNRTVDGGLLGYKVRCGQEDCRLTTRTGSVALAIVVGCAVCLPGAQAALGTLTLWGDAENPVVVQLSTGTLGGSCATSTMYDAFLGAIPQLTCSSGSNIAVANAYQGCTTQSGLAVCASPWDAEEFSPQASSQLKCVPGTSYQLSTGNTTGTCTRTGASGGTMSCDAGSANFAAADCRKGCGNTGGAGRCCRAGTPGCTAGPNCHRIPA
jgi:hypothetical protein